MKRLAIILEGNLGNRKGQINASLSRAENLICLQKYAIDVYCIQSRASLLFRLVKGGKRKPLSSELEVDGINIKVLWTTMYLFDYLWSIKLGHRKLFGGNELDKFVPLFSGYDLISAHSFKSGCLAEKIHERFGTPFTITWHGSDIHTLPKKNRSVKYETIRLIESANCNFFVSQSLLEQSKELTLNGNKKVLYNGVSPIFVEYGFSEKKKVRENNGVNEERVIAYVGSLYSIKNILVLPNIFASVYQQRKDTVFWIIGDGGLNSQLRMELDKKGLPFKMFGDMPPESMPDLMNCMDVLVLPSKNEGLPLVVLEAISCGANVVGSNVGGIPEVIGKDNTFDLDSQFVQNISERILFFLDHSVRQEIGDEFSWGKTVLLEAQVYEDIFKNN